MLSRICLLCLSGTLLNIEKTSGTGFFCFFGKMTMLKLKIHPPPTSGDGQETSHCSGSLALHVGSSLGETCVEAELRAPVGMCQEASARTWISVSARIVGHKVSLTSSRNAGLSSQRSQGLISAALKGDMVKCRVLLGLKAKGTGTERCHPSRGPATRDCPHPCRRCRWRQSSPQGGGQSIQGGKFLAPPKHRKTASTGSFCERLWKEGC